MPSLALGREHLAQNVFGRIATLRRLDAYAADEPQAIEIAIAFDLPGLLRRLAPIIRSDAARRFEHGPDPSARDFRGLDVPLRRPGDRQQRPELALLE